MKRTATTILVAALATGCATTATQVNQVLMRNISGPPAGASAWAPIAKQALTAPNLTECRDRMLDGARAADLPQGMYMAEALLNPRNDGHDADVALAAGLTVAAGPNGRKTAAGSCRIMWGAK